MFHLRGIPYSLDLNQRMNFFLGKKCILPNKNVKYMSLSFLDYIITMMMQSPPEMLTLQKYFSLSLCHSFCWSYNLFYYAFIFIICITNWHYFDHNSNAILCHLFFGNWIQKKKIRAWNTPTKYPTLILSTLWKRLMPLLNLLGSQSYLDYCYLKAELFMFFHLLLSPLGSWSF